MATDSSIPRAAASLAARGRRLLLTTFVVAIGALAATPAASAHLRSGTLAVDYQVSLWDHATAAYEARIYQSDHGLTLTVRPGHVVALVGYLGEPVFRLDAHGLWINAASPTAVAVKLLGKSAAVDSSAPAWQAHPGRRTVTWHDARAQGLPPGLNAGIWHVPLIVDGRRTWLEGALRRLPRPAWWLWVAVLGCWLLLGGCVAWHGRATSAGGRAVTWLAQCAAAAAALAIIGFALDAYASPGTWILGFDAIAFLAAGLAVLHRGPEHLRAAGAIGTGLVALAIGVFMIPAFLHPLVLSVLPGTLTRLLAVAAIGAGLDAAGLAGRQYTGTAATPATEPDAVAWPPV
jgi:hypothetical protein